MTQHEIIREVPAAPRRLRNPLPPTRLTIQTPRRVLFSLRLKWETRRKTDLKTVLVWSEWAKRAAHFLPSTGSVLQFSHANLSSTEAEVSDIDTGEDRGRRHLVTDPQAPNRVLRNSKPWWGVIAPSSQHHEWIDSGFTSPIFAQVRSKPNITNWRVLGEIGFSGERSGCKSNKTGGDGKLIHDARCMA